MHLAASCLAALPACKLEGAVTDVVLGKFSCLSRLGNCCQGVLPSPKGMPTQIMHGYSIAKVQWAKNGGLAFSFPVVSFLHLGSLQMSQAIIVGSSLMGSGEGECRRSTGNTWPVNIGTLVASRAGLIGSLGLLLIDNLD
jgi:hypothetical protein